MCAETDISPEQMRRLAGIRAVLCDLDGTIYLGDDVFPWSAAFVHAVRNSGRRIIFFTNNSSRDAEHYAAKLSRMGIPCDRGDVLTAGDATVDYLRGQASVRRVLALGTRSFECELADAGFELVAQAPDVVVVAFDTELTYDKLRRACRALLDGVPYVATHPDLVCPTPDGPIPDCGAICALIRAATGREPVVIGKPHRGMVDAALARLGALPEHTCIIGDRLYTDVRMGRDHGLTSILVLSGETTLEMLGATGDAPDIVLPDAGALAAIFNDHPISELGGGT